MAKKLCILIKYASIPRDGYGSNLCKDGIKNETNG